LQKAQSLYCTLLISADQYKIWHLWNQQPADFTHWLPTTKTKT